MNKPLSPFSLSSIRVVVFDWDGTLMDSTGAISLSIQAAAADLNLPVPTRKQASSVIGLALHQAIANAVPEASSAQLPVLIERYKYHYLQKDNDLHPFGGIVDLLNSLRDFNMPIAIATGKSNIGLIRALEKLQWRARFVTTRCADQGESKPHPWMLTDICEELGCDTSQALMIGDTTHDLGMAKNAGSPSVAVSWGAHDTENFTNFEPVQTFSEVQQLHDWLIKGLQNKPIEDSTIRR